MKAINARVIVCVLMSMFMMQVSAQTSNSEKKEQSAVLRINRTRQVVTAETKTDTVVATKTRVNEVSDEYKMARYEAKLRGEKAPGAWFDGHNKDITGRVLSRPFVELGGGGTYLFSDKEFRPELILNAGWEMRYFLFLVSGGFSWKGFNDDAEASGRYNTFFLTAGGGPKVWSSDDFLSYLALIGQVGYGYEQTDGTSDDIRASSTFYGLKWRGFVRFHYGFNQHWGVSLDAGVTNTTRNFHNSDQDKGAVTGELVGTITYAF